MVTTRSAALTAIVLVAASCSKANSNTPSAAIDRQFTLVRQNMLTGAQTIDPSLYWVDPGPNGNNSNPAGYPANSSVDTTLGTAADDGTSGMEVTVANNFVLNADQSGALTTTITEKSTGFVFYSLTSTVKPPTINYYLPQYALSALKADGTGQAFVMITFQTTGAISRTYTNVNPANGHSLINFGSYPVPSGTATGTGTGINNYLVEFDIQSVGGQLTAKLGPGANISYGQVRVQRDGGPSETPASLSFTSSMFGSLSSGMANDFLVPVGPDAPNGIAATAAVNIAATGVGGTASETPVWQYQGPVVSQMGEGMGTAVTLNDTLAGLTETGDGTVQIDASLQLAWGSGEDEPPLDVSISPDDTGVMDVVSGAYLLCNSGVIVNWIFMQ